MLYLHSHAHAVGRVTQSPQKGVTANLAGFWGMTSNVMSLPYAQNWNV